jgi:hypothetical protein
MQIPLKPLVSAYLCSPARTLYAVCREAGRDDGGRACATCLVRDICAADRGRPEHSDAD